MKKITLDQAWKLCLKQWKWIIEQLEHDSKFGVTELKSRWLDNHGYQDYDERPADDCFFCEFAHQQPAKDDICDSCPGRLVNKRFSCINTTYHYFAQPKRFYKKLLALNAKRLKAKQS